MQSGQRRLPLPGTLHHLRTPTAYGDTYVDAETRASSSGNAVRLDTGVIESDEISVFYDPMTPLIVRARIGQRLQLLRRALSDWQTVGLPTNVPFLKRCCDTSAFSVRLYTAFIDEHSAEPPRDAAMSPSRFKLTALAWLTTAASSFSAAPVTQLTVGNLPVCAPQ